MKGNKPENTEQVYWYERAPDDLQNGLKSVAERAYLALDGNGYGRVDMRTESMEDAAPWVLEVNANCGVSFNVDEFTSTHGEILRLSKSSVEQFTHHLLQYALKRQASRAATASAALLPSPPAAQ